MTQMTIKQAEAISRMASGRPQYNEGVLSMLGLDDLAYKHAAAWGWAQRVAAKREEIDAGLRMFEPSRVSPELNAEQDSANAECAAAWAPIEALIQEARAILDDSDDATPAYGEHV